MSIAQGDNYQPERSHAATLYTLNIIFDRQMLQWCKVEGYKLLREVDLRIVQSFRASWKDGALAKK